MMEGNLVCKYCNEQFSDPAKARAHSGQLGHQVRPLEPDEFDQPPASEPISGYTAETTGEYCQLELESADGQTHDLTDDIARTTTRAGGRVPTDITATITRRSRHLECEWTVYASAPNPFHVASELMDLLLEADGVESVQVDISDRTPAEITEMIRGTRMGFTFDLDDYEDLEETIRALRWQGGVEGDNLVSLENLDLADRENVQDLAAAAGDAWDHYSVAISIRQRRESVPNL